jgi:hypothetical protein
MKRCRGAARWAALFCWWMVPLACREGSNSPVTPESISFDFALTVGSSYTYDAILVNPSGYYIPSSKCRAVQRVTATGGAIAGFSGVSTLADSTILLRDTTGVVQNIWLAKSNDGDLYRFGLVAELARAMKLPACEARWDCMAAFSRGLGSSWVVGYLDSAKQQAVYGSFDGTTETYIAAVNGVQTLISCYRVNVEGDGIGYIFWVSDSPPAFLRYVLLPGYTTEGAEFSLTDVHLTTQ